MLSITPNFSDDDLRRTIQEDLEIIIAEMADRMFEAGCRVVDLARAKTKSDGGFGNITWNLRGSIGCALLINHQLPEEYIYFPSLGQGEEGRQKGIDFAKEIALMVDDGEPVLIMVAGEEYAAFVEALHDYDVISGSVDKFSSLLKKVLQ